MTLNLPTGELEYNGTAIKLPKTLHGTLVSGTITALTEDTTSIAIGDSGYTGGLFFMRDNNTRTSSDGYLGAMCNIRSAESANAAVSLNFSSYPSCFYTTSTTGQISDKFFQQTTGSIYLRNVYIDGTNLEVVFYNSHATNSGGVNNPYVALLW